MPAVRSPNGAHLYYRCPGLIDGNKKLAQHQGDDGKLHTLIETRGEGGYIVAPGSPPSCHPTGKEYLLEYGSLSSVPIISADTRQTLLDVAASFNQYSKEVYTPYSVSSKQNDVLRPGDDFNARANWQTDILLPAGCRELYSRGEESYWAKPHSLSKAPHATLNWKGIDKFYVFSSAFPGLDSERAYDKFQCYTHLFHNGDFAESAKALSAKGYGARSDESSKQSAQIDAGADDDVTPEPIPILDKTGFYGLAGEFALEAAKQSEGDPAAILIQSLANFSIASGRNKFFRIGFSFHHPRIFAVLVGNSSKARKGTSWEPVKALFKRMSELGSDVPDSRPGPFSSGEGLIFAVRDPSEPAPETEISRDPGIKDKRLLVCTSEFASGLRVMRREGNTLSTIIRSLFDGEDISPLVKNNPIKATAPHVGIVGHITKRELLKELDHVEIFNGFGNRFLWPFYVAKSWCHFQKQLKRGDSMSLR